MKKSILLVLLMSVEILTMKAQYPISLSEAVRKALVSYPSLSASRWNTMSYRAMEGTAWDIGATELSSGAEEMGKGNEGIRTLFNVRQELDILAIKSRRNFLRQQTRLAEGENRLLEREMAREVSLDYVHAFIARLKRNHYVQLDSIYSAFEQAAVLRYRTQTTSELEYLSAQNQSRKVSVILEQAEHDLLMANQKLSRWLDGDTLYTTVDPNEDNRENDMDTSFTAHPVLRLARQKIDVADASIRMARSAYWPKFYAEFGSQEIGSSKGYYSWQIGLSIPLVFGATKARVRSAQMERRRIEAELESNRRQLTNSYRNLQAEYEKWKKSVSYYRQTVLPLAKAQKEKALLTYREGATGYLEFIQNLHEAVQTEIDYIDVYGRYLETKLNLKYY